MGHAMPERLSSAPRHPSVPTYLTNEASFELDGSFTDHTAHHLESLLGDDARLGLWLFREPLPAGSALRDAATAHVAERRDRVDGYEVLAERDGEVAGAAAIEFRARFREDDAIVYERQTHFAVGGVRHCLTTRAPIADRTACDDAMDRVVATLLLRGDS
jgi:hypothetical protein